MTYIHTILTICCIGDNRSLWVPTEKKNYLLISQTEISLQEKDDFKKMGFFLGTIGYLPGTFVIYNLEHRRSGIKELT